MTISTGNIGAGALERLRAGQTDDRRLRSDRVRALSQAYVQNPRDDQLAVALNDLIDAKIRHFEAVAEGPHRNVGRLSEGGLLAVLGDSGAGKTRLLERHLHNRVEFKGYGTSDCLLISVKARSPFSFSGFARDLAAAAGLEVEKTFKNRDEAFSFAHKQLVNRIAFVHIDEIQLFLTGAHHDDLAAGQNLLRSLCQNSDWPISLIISGLPVAAKLFADNQVTRRQKIIKLTAVDVPRDLSTLNRGYVDFLAKAGIDSDIDLRHLAPRLAHACLGQLGDCFAVMVNAMDIALRLGAKTLSMSHFVQAFRERVDCPDDHNVFHPGVVDFETIDVIALYEQKRGEDARRARQEKAAAKGSTAVQQAAPPADPKPPRVERSK
jgi:hypothetical protein